MGARGRATAAGVSSGVQGRREWGGGVTQTGKGLPQVKRAYLDEVQDVLPDGPSLLWFVW